MQLRDEDIFEYHERPRPGKLEVQTSKPCLTQRDLSMAYTPGVARPCLAIEKDPEAAYHYTGKGNLVAVVSNGTAVLGLGDIGALAGKPVMEGKGVLFKRFADIDVFDIEIDARDPEDVVRIVRALEPTFGGINLEDIKAPECFYIEETLRREMNIPVFHDDQHGTAIISGAALLNALTIVGKRIDDVKVVFCGAGAAGIACAEMYLRLGVRRENVLLVDTVGVVYEGRTEKMNPYKARFAAETGLRTLADAMQGADVFVGVSARDQLTPDMLRSMNANPIVLAMANPDPEITWEAAFATRPDVIMATGRSDYPNQVNNVLGFPFIFRGALDVRASAINDEMKVAAVQALAQLAREDVPEQVLKAYGVDRLHFGREYLIPKPFDPRVLLWVAPAVAKAAMASGVARKPIADLQAYRESLERIMGPSREVMHLVMHKAQNQQPRRLVFPEGEDETIIRAARAIADDRIARPILLGRREVIEQRTAELGFALHDYDVIDIERSPDRTKYADLLYQLRSRKGMTPRRALTRVLDPTIFALMMVRTGEADGFVGGIDAAVSGDDPSGHQARRAQARRVARVGTPPAGAQGPPVLLRRYDGEHRSLGGRTRGDRVPGSRHRACVRHRAARGDAVVLQLRLGAASAGRTRRGSCRSRASDASGARDRRRNAPRHRRGRGDRARELPALAHPGRRQRAHLPQPRSRQHRLQAGAAVGSRRNDRPDPDGHAEAGERAAARHDRRRHRQPRSDHRRRGRPVGRSGHRARRAGGSSIR